MEAALQGPTGQTVLGASVLTIGRAGDNQLVISDGRASSHHAEIRQDVGGQSYSVTDLGSTNGTFINEQQIERHVPRMLNSGDRVRVGDTVFTYEVSGPYQSASNVYSNPGNDPAYLPTVGVAPPDPYYGANAQQGYQAPPPPYAPYPAPPQPVYGQQPAPLPPVYPPPVPVKKRRTSLWIVLGIVGVIVVACIALGAIVLVTQSTPTKTLQAYCSAVKQRDYPTAYNQFSKRQQALQTETQFANNFRAVTVTDCQVSNVNDTAGTGTITYVTDKGTLVADETLVQESGTWKLDFEKPRSATP